MANLKKTTRLIVSEIGKMKVTALTIVLTAAMFMAGCVSTATGEDKSEQKKPAKDRKDLQKKISLKVETVTAKKSQFDVKLVLPGQVDPQRKLQVAPLMPGKIKKLHVDEGDKVKKGDVLFEMDDMQAQLQKKQGKAGLNLAHIGHKHAKKEFNRAKRLFDKGALTKQQYDQAKFYLDQAGGQIQNVKAQIALVDYALEQAKVVAPFDAVVLQNSLEEHMYVNPMAVMPGGPSMVISDIETVKIKTHVSDSDFSKIKKGLSADIELSSYPDTLFKGKVTEVELIADPLSKTFEVNITVDNASGKLHPGMYAGVNLIIEKLSGVIVVPESAILHRNGKEIVFVIADGNKAVLKVIKSGTYSRGFVVLDSGVAPGDKIITKGNAGLKNGSIVEVVGSDSSSEMNGTNSGGGN